MNQIPPELLERQLQAIVSVRQGIRDALAALDRMDLAVDDLAEATAESNGVVFTRHSIFDETPVTKNFNRKNFN